MPDPMHLAYSVTIWWALHLLSCYLLKSLKMLLMFYVFLCFVEGLCLHF